MPYCSASQTGLCTGSTCTPWPRRIRDVRIARAARNRLGCGASVHPSKWCSVTK